MGENPLLESALDLAARGYRVFPLQPGAKQPAIKDWPNLATSDPEQINRVWGARDFNIGVACGSGLLGLDVDMKNGKDGLASLKALGVDPEGLVVKTPTGGLHVYYAGPDVSNSAGKLGLGLDIRSAGGFLVGPGSIINGRLYEIVADAPVARCPEAIRSRLDDKLTRHLAATVPLVDLDRPDTIDRAIAYLKRTPGAVEGLSGDAETFKIAATLKDYGVSQDMAVELMAEHWNDQCSPPWDHEDLQTKVANAYEYGSKQPGAEHPAHEFAGVHVVPPERPVQAPSAWFRHGEASEGLDASWLFFQMLPATGVAVLLAHSQAGKTFVGLELARCVATGKEFFKTAPDDIGGTLFVFAGTEGGGLKRRLAALEEDFPLPISSTICGNLAERDALANLLADLRTEAAHVLATFGVPVRLIVLETLAASGLIEDENDNSEASRAMANLATISREMNALVLTTHHPSKNGRGARGASAIPSSADYTLEIIRNDKETVRELELTKARDAEQRKLGTFTLVPVDLGADSRGRRITSMRISQGETMSNTTRAAAHSDLLLECVEWAFMSEDTDLVEGRPAVDLEAVRLIFKERKPGSKDSGNLSRAFKAALSHIENLGAVEVIPHAGAKFIRKREVTL